MGCISNFGHLTIESSLIQMEITHVIPPHEMEVANNLLESDIAADGVIIWDSLGKTNDSSRSHQEIVLERTYLEDVSK